MKAHEMTPEELAKLRCGNSCVAEHNAPYDPEIGTGLYQFILDRSAGDDERDVLMRKVWEPTPWVINVFEGSYDEYNFIDIIRWCCDNLGDESYPIHDKVGVWHRGGATVDGYTWYGFASEELMQRFIDAHPEETKNCNDE